MTLQEIIQFVNFIIKKSQAGETMTPEQFNVLVKGFNLQLFNDEFDQVEVMAKSQNRPIYSVLHTSGALLRFIEVASLTVTNGEAPKPPDYVHYTGLITRYAGSYRKVDIISEEEMNNRRSSLMDSPLDIVPACVVYGNKLRFFPKDVGAQPNQGYTDLSYLRMPVTPVYDFCLQATGKVVYMPVGSKIHSVGVTDNLYAQGSNALIAADVFHQSKVVGTDYLSITKELDWDEKYHMRFVKALLQAVAPSLDPNLLSQYVKETKQ